MIIKNLHRVVNFLKKGNVVLCVLSLLVSTSAFGQATFTTNPNNALIIDYLTGSGLGITNPNLDAGHRDRQIVVFSNGIAGANLGIDEGVFFSTGYANLDLSTQNSMPDASRNPGGSGNSPYLLALDNRAGYNTVSYSFDITLDPNTTGIRIVFQFGSEEYPDYVGSSFNDLFGFFISGPGITGGNVPGYPNVRNVALLPSNDSRIAVNTVNGGELGYAADGTSTDLTQTQYYINNGHSGVSSSVHIEYNGLTTAITRDIAGLQSGQTYRFTVAIADVGDDAYDSCVLLKQIIGLNEADLSIEKTVDNMSPGHGSDVAFTLTAKNGGPNNVAEVIAEDLLPSGYTFVSAAPDKGTYDDVTGIWDIGNLAIGEEVQLLITARVNATGDYRNLTNIQAGSAVDPDQTNNFDEITLTPFAPNPSFTLVKSAAITTDNGTAGIADEDDVITYTFTVRNTGNTTLSDIVVSDDLDGLGTISPASVTSLAAGATATFSATYTVTEDDVIAGRIENVAAVNGKTRNATGTVVNMSEVESTPGSSGDPAQPDPTKGPGDPTVVLIPHADLVMEKTVSNAAPKMGETVTFTLTVTNNGSGAATNVVITDVVDTDAYTIGTINNGGTNTAGTLTWTTANLANGAQYVVTFTATVIQAGTSDNTASVAAATYDPATTNNSDNVTVERCAAPAGQVSLTGNTLDNKQ